MRTINLLDGLEFHDKNPYAQPLYVDDLGRVLRFALRPGQSIQPHEAPNSPFYLVVLQGHGLFAGADGREREFGPNSLLIFDPGEVHAVRALNEDLVFVGFLHGAPGARHGQVGGLMAEEAR